MQIALQIRYQKDTQLRSQTACAPEALGRIPVRYAKAAAPRQREECALLFLFNEFLYKLVIKILENLMQGMPFGHC